ncbi:MANSC domain-containing protein 1 [Holothuria leucospilota]|uniref:MANSC domain-containing protein 1 n=1 Tax=Holothuria leucospilota TaxID=206669 RepID=A0A9Q1BTI6_HOLLE|nr:MANSC domain-containing protein 1 [Holothuria leucospilota]
MKSFISTSVVYCIFLSLMLPIGIEVKAEFIPQPTCPVSISRNHVLNLEQSEVSVLGGYHKDTMDDCIAGCCQQEWKLERTDVRGHCNLVTFYPQEDESVMNCFMVQCTTCFFVRQDDFSYAWVRRPVHPDNNNHLAFEEINSFPSHNTLPSSLSLNQMKQSSSNSMTSSKFTSLLDVIKNAINWSKGVVSSSVERIRRSVYRREDASKAKVEPTVEKSVTTPSPSNSKVEPAASESQPSPSSTTKPLEKLQTSVKFSESASTITPTKAIDVVLGNDTVTSKAENASPSPESNPDVTQGETGAVTTSSANGKVSSTADEEEQSTTDTLPEEAKSSTTAKPTTKTGSTTEAINSGSKSTTKAQSTPTTVSTTEAVTTPQSKSTPKPESTSNTGSTTKFVSATPKLGLSSTSAQVSTTRKPETTPMQESVSQEKTASTKAGSTSKSQPKISSEASSESQTEKQTRSTTMAFVSEEIVTSATAGDGSKEAAVFTFETNNFVLILSLVLGVVLVAVVTVVLGKRWYEAYQRRHYNKVDYLINGS